MKTSVLSYLEETAQRLPDKVAYFDLEHEITFSELRKRSIDLAFVIKEKIDGRRNPILIYLPKTIESIVGFMGVLYSGNFYTPTDVRFPLEKVKSVIETLNPSAIIVDSKTREEIMKIDRVEKKCLINIDDVQKSNRYDEASSLISQILDVDPVYVLFTSGSTGTPKGVIINNHSLIDHVEWATTMLHIDERTIMGNQSPFYFDMSTQDIYTPLKTGATLGIIPVKYFAFPIKVLEFLKERNINFLFWVPSAFVSIANYDLLKHVALDQVECIMFGGEVMPVKQLNYWRNHLPNLKTIAHIYGPTEATVYCTYYIVDREFADTEILPLGKACGNTGLLVMGDEGNIINENQINVLGELCVYGSSLSAGYWDDEQRTNEKYIDNPCCKYYKEKMYMTGDLVYYNERKELVFAGRKDFQIKHSGYRIELGEIESAAMSMVGVKNACALYHYEQKQIVLFYQGDLLEDDVKRYLLSVIPKYMVPAIYYQLRSFPYNDNGKIDRKSLEEIYIK